ncbi:putative intramolecular chaperone auto-processing domain-containing protein [Plasmopara halstedii]
MPIFMESSNATPNGFVLQLSNATNATSTTSAYFGITTFNDLVMMTANTRRLIITSTGSVGIGIGSPNAPLQVAGSNTSITIKPVSTISYSYDVASNAWANRGSRPFTLTNVSASFGGNIYIQAGIWATSDRRLKEDINEIDLPFERYKDLKSISYSYKKEAKKRVVLTAQDVLRVKTHRKEHLNRQKDYCIINMGTPQIGGTHCLAVSNKHKTYFDSLGLPRPRVIPKDYSCRKENYDKFFVKVFCRGKAFWCFFICYDLDEDAFVLQFDQLLCHEHPLKYGERIMTKQPTPKSKPEVIVESKLTLDDLNRITKNTSLAKDFVEIPSLEQLLAKYHGLSFECICRCRFQLGITEKGIKFVEEDKKALVPDCIYECENGPKVKKISGKPPRGATTGRLVLGVSAASNTSAAGICTNGLFPVIQGVSIGTGIGTRGNSRR